MSDDNLQGRIVPGLLAGIAVVLLLVSSILPFASALGGLVKATPWQIQGEWYWGDEAYETCAESGPSCEIGVRLVRLAGPLILVASLLAFGTAFSMMNQSRREGFLLAAATISMTLLGAFVLGLGLRTMVGEYWALANLSSGFYFMVGTVLLLATAAVLGIRIENPRVKVQAATAGLSAGSPAEMPNGPTKSEGENLICPKCRSTVRLRPTGHPVCWSCGFGG